MTDSLFNYALFGYILSKFKYKRNIQTDIKIDSISETERTVTLFGEQHTFTDIDCLIEVSDGTKIFLNALDNKTVVAVVRMINERRLVQKYEVYSTKNGTAIVLSVNKNTIKSIHTIESTSTNCVVNVRISMCRGKNYSVGPVDNLIMLIMVGYFKIRSNAKAQLKGNIYCAHSDDNSIWFMRRNGESVILKSTYYKNETKYVFEYITSDKRYSLYRFRNTTIATLRKDDEDVERDVSLSKNTVYENDSNRSFIRVQKGTHVLFITK